MDYRCAKFGDFSFSRFGFIVRTDRQADRQNHSRRMTVIQHRCLHADVSHAAQTSCTRSFSKSIEYGSARVYGPSLKNLHNMFQTKVGNIFLSILSEGPCHKQLETKAMTTSSHCNTGRMSAILPIITREKNFPIVAIQIHLVQKITIIRAQKIGKFAV